nr:exonuclease domain-containing protein [Cohnella faecalis]
MKFAVLDFETTGMSSDKDDIIQAGIAVVDEYGTLLSSYASYVRPARRFRRKLRRLPGSRTRMSAKRRSLTRL